jgi:MoaA/NifB/PqqE/SkfB family radical SAM enzyme
MVIMLTYRCSLDCDHCLVSKTGPGAEHMSKETLEETLRVFKKIGSNDLGIAGGEPLEHPLFWEVVKTLRDAALEHGFIVRVGTSGALLRGRLAEIKSLAPVAFQVTADFRFYPQLDFVDELRALKNVKVISYLSSIYVGEKAKRRGWKPPPGTKIREKNRYCVHANRLLKRGAGDANFRSFVRMWEALDGTCSIHVHPGGEVRMGPLDCCMKVTTIDELRADWKSASRAAMERIRTILPCGKCGLKDVEKSHIRRSDRGRSRWSRCGAEAGH